jgi:hypothetical protein
MGKQNVPETLQSLASQLPVWPVACSPNRFGDAPPCPAAHADHFLREFNWHEVFRVDAVFHIDSSYGGQWSQQFAPAIR